MSGNLFSRRALCPAITRPVPSPLGSGTGQLHGRGPWPWLDASRCGAEASRSKGMEARGGRIAVPLRRAARGMRRCGVSCQNRHWPPLQAPNTVDPRDMGRIRDGKEEDEVPKGRPASGGPPASCCGGLDSDPGFVLKNTPAYFQINP
ncbi:hypothetical protein PAHAL_8G256700 [Panicum hallii]|uniref:Uncharacterized protein n=1 Tax=Panicum hallii TaxID=206008 RepID=A0A2T8IAD1_9POAL|nr:hypothetical protein PAHAL_8G256700 [Panicum hallii]